MTKQIKIVTTGSVHGFALGRNIRITDEDGKPLPGIITKVEILPICDADKPAQARITFDGPLLDISAAPAGVSMTWVQRIKAWLGVSLHG